jgi:phosphoribosylglycinamide formyltransferase 1
MMAECAVFASGTGTNFRALLDALSGTPHSVACLIHDRPNAGARCIARERGVPAYHVSYKGKTRQAAEQEIAAHLSRYNVQLLVLAGFMRILTPYIIDLYPGRIINIHPSLLPRHPGTGAIEKSFHSGDTELGVTVHYVDYGVDTGPVYAQRSFPRSDVRTLTEAEERIHAIEHTLYPECVITLLDGCDNAVPEKEADQS